MAAATPTNLAEAVGKPRPLERAVSDDDVRIIGYILLRGPFYAALYGVILLIQLMQRL